MTTRPRQIVKNRPTETATSATAIGCAIGAVTAGNWAAAGGFVLIAILGPAVTYLNRRAGS